MTEQKLNNSQGSKYFDAYTEQFNKNSNEDPTIRVLESMRSVTDAMLKDMSVANRLMLALGSIVANNLTNDRINWNKINEILHANINQYDFNIFDNITSIDELSSARLAMVCAENDVGPWQRHVCKDCGATFYLNCGEVNFYKKNDLNIPKRCKCCRDKRSEGKTKPTTISAKADISSVRTTNDKTAMQIAMEKAGL